MTTRVRLQVLCCGLLSSLALASFAQNIPLLPSDPRLKTYEAKLESLPSAGMTAPNAEFLRAKVERCAATASNAERNECIGRDFRISWNNDENLAKAIGGILRMKDPEASADELSSAPDKGKEFDDAEKYWLRYRDTQCRASADIFFSGTIAPQIHLTCRQNLTRRHMQELASIYADLWL